MACARVEYDRPGPAGPVPMEVDEVNASAEDGFSKDETEEMDYTTSNGAPQPCRTPSQVV